MQVLLVLFPQVENRENFVFHPVFFFDYTSYYFIQKTNFKLR